MSEKIANGSSTLIVFRTRTAERILKTWSKYFDDTL